MKFEDHFSQHAQTYAQYRPVYPAELFAFLSTVTAEHRLAWDCATGNGQAALGLVDYFERVIASDASAEQISQAVPHPKISYRVEPAEETSLDPASVDLVTVAVAVHWFDHDRFYSEVRRVLKSGGVIAVWTYQRPVISPEIDQLIAHLDDEILAGDWPERVHYLKERYRTLPFPFEEIPAPEFTLQAGWPFGQLVGFINSWSGVRRFENRTDQNPLALIGDRLLDAWGDPDQARTIRWPLSLRVGRKDT